jgi:hypothetical protein
VFVRGLAPFLLLVILAISGAFVRVLRPAVFSVHRFSRERASR